MSDAMSRARKAPTPPDALSRHGDGRAVSRRAEKGLVRVRSARQSVLCARPREAAGNAEEISETYSIGFERDSW